MVVIGLGPGGEATASELARAGLSVVGVDERLVGGECPYFGCVPSKMMVRAGDALGEAGRVNGLAGSIEVRPDWAPVATRIRDEATDDWDDQVAVDRLKEAGVRFVRGHARLAGTRTVEVNDELFEATLGVVLNPGTSPAVPPIEGLADTPYWTNRDVVRVETLPGSMAVIGGGAIGAEIAQAFSRFGVRVSVLEVADRILAPEEPEASRLLADVFAHERIQVLTGVTIGSVAYEDGRFRISVDGQDLDVEKLLVAAGRRPNLTDLGLESVGLDPAARSIEVDARMRAGEGLWAIGDVVDMGAFTHMSMYHSAICTRDILGQDGPQADSRAVPRVTFTDPEVASVGLTEAQAREQGIEVRVGQTDLATSSRGWIAKAQGLVKLVEDAEHGVLVGATAVGPSGGEMLSMLTLAIHAKVPTAKLRSMIYAYPTFHRAVEDALGDLGE